MFDSIFSSTEMVSYAASDILICTAVSLLLGLMIAVVFHIRKEGSRGFKISMMILPVLVQAVIMMVNGNLGTSVAVLGAFSLVRFRSVPGSSKEICGVFFAMAVGLATAMGCIGFACLLTAIVGVVLLGGEKVFSMLASEEKALRITIPENLDYTTVFDEIFEKYTQKAQLERVKTTNLGSMFELSYCVQLKGNVSEKEMIDKIRCKNGNLTVICGRETESGTL